MATLYFNGAVDSDWDTLGNWWTDSGHTSAAAGLPTSSDSAVLSELCNSNSGSTPTVVNLTVGYGEFPISVTVTGVATFTGESQLYVDGIITGNATFNDNSANNGGFVSGNATFNGESRNLYGGSGVGGNATFNGSSSNGMNDGSLGGTVQGNATFNDAASNGGGFVSGNATFSLSSAATEIAGDYGGTFGSVSFAYEKGINGSSILGVI
jgi:hypothetical protein